MFSPARLLTLAALAISCTEALVYPVNQGQPDAADAGGIELPKTDSDTIASTAQAVDQKEGANTDAPPNQPPPQVAITAIDGNVLDNSVAVSSATASRRGFRRDSNNGKYEQVFAGTGTGLGARDGSIEGTAYLTYTVVPNNTYSVQPCLDFCDRVDGCVFVNLYYEFNNALLDWVFSEKSNLKCAAYGDIHTAAEKTNRGGQQLEPAPHNLTFIQQSSGYALTSLVDPATPDGYELVFGPTNGANNADGYMGFAFLTRYDVDACAQLCKERGEDQNGGRCKYFNIWRAVFSNGSPQTYTCSMYTKPTDASTAVNFGQGDLKVTLSRGYRRKTLVPDGDFESYNCPGNAGFCFTAATSTWTGITPAGGQLDASIFHYSPYAHLGNGVGLLGSGFGTDALPGTLTPAHSLATVAGKQYSIQFFLSSTYSGPSLEAAAFVNVTWNGQVVSNLKTGYAPWHYYETTVTAKGNDVLAFVGGQSPAYTFVDDVYVFSL